MAILLGSAHFAWSIYAQHQFEAMLTRSQDAELPVTLADFNAQPPPSDDSALGLIRQAHAALPMNLYVCSHRERRNGEIDWDAAEYSTRQSARALNLARQAREHEVQGWGNLPRSPFLTGLLSTLSNHRTLSRAQSMAAYLACRRGDGREAVELAHDIYVSARAVSRDPPMYMTYNVSVGIDSLAAAVLEHVLPTLDARDANTRSALLSLQTRLQDEASLHHDYQLSVCGDRAGLLDTVTALIDGTLRPSALPVSMSPSPAIFDPVQRWIVGPSWRLYAVSIAESYHRRIVAAEDAAYPVGIASIRYLPVDIHASDDIMRRVNRVPNALAELFYRDPAIDFAMYTHVIASHRLATAAIAVRLHECDHGRRPTTLAELVPDYLPAVPIDPFVDDGAPLRYLPDAEPPMLYSVGRDGIDDGGGVLSARGFGSSPHDRDITWFLDGQRPIDDDKRARRGAPVTRLRTLLAELAERQAPQDDADIQLDEYQDTDQPEQNDGEHIEHTDDE